MESETEAEAMTMAGKRSKMRQTLIQNSYKLPQNMAKSEHRAHNSKASLPALS